MKRLRLLTVTAVSLVAISMLTYCGSQSAEKQLLEIDKAKFDETSINIDNPWLPLKPGMQYVYDGHTIDEGEKIEHRIIFTVTDLIKVINGVNVVVIHDRDLSQGQLKESELTFFAQDVDGNVWHLGQHSETYNESEFVGGRAWMVGHLEGAKAGIMMKANPKPGTPDYSEGYAPPPYNWTDRAKVHKMGESTTVPAGSYSDVLITEETSDEEPGASQLKYYARGVGVVRVGFTGDDPSKEELELVQINQLTPEQMDETRAEALALETRAYVYATTKPAVKRENP